MDTNPQLSSPLFRLPPELREEIYTLCLTSASPITDPTIDFAIRPKHKHVPPLGTPLLRACRRIHQECDALPLLYQQNTFRFTRPSIASDFFIRLSPQNRALIDAVLVDLRLCLQNEGFGSTNDLLAMEWVHYIDCPTCQPSGPRTCQCMALGSIHLASTLPHLRRLTLDIVEVQKGAAGIAEAQWDLLGRFLSGIFDESCYRLATLKIWIRGLDVKNEVVEVAAPLLGGGCGEVEEVVMAWRREMCSFERGRFLAK